jgi:hypothetical protein
MPVLGKKKLPHYYPKVNTVNSFSRLKRIVAAAKK